MKRLMGAPQIEIINFNDFMSGKYKLKGQPIKVYGYYLSPMTLMDPVVLGFSGFFIGASLIQARLNSQGKYEESERVNALIHMGATCVAFFFIYKLLKITAGVFL